MDTTIIVQTIYLKNKCLHKTENHLMNVSTYENFASSTRFF